MLFPACSQTTESWIWWCLILCSFLEQWSTELVRFGMPPLNLPWTMASPFFLVETSLLQALLPACNWNQFRTKVRGRQLAYAMTCELWIGHISALSHVLVLKGKKKKSLFSLMPCFLGIMSLATGLWGREVCEDECQVAGGREEGGRKKWKYILLYVYLHCQCWFVFIRREIREILTLDCTIFKRNRMRWEQYQASSWWRQCCRVSGFDALQHSMLSP